MDDKELDRLLSQAAEHWRVPVDPPLDAIWDQVAAESFRPAARRAPGWGMVGIAAAAALIVGVAGGRYSISRGASPTRVPTTATLPAAAADPNQRAMSELLGRTAVLLAALPAENTAARDADPGIATEGARLLTTTRLLLDSPAGANPRLHNLLQDLELVLAQVARLAPQHRRDDIQFIQTALDEHDIVPRLRSAAADLSLQDF